MLLLIEAAILGALFMCMGNKYNNQEIFVSFELTIGNSNPESSLINDLWC